MRARALQAAVACLFCVACSTQSTPATLTPAPAPPPTATAVPNATPVPTLDAATSDVQDAFLTNLNDLTSDVETLAGAECTDLTAETQANPQELASIRGFAATLQRAAASQAALNSDDVRSSLADLTKALSQLDIQLATCGIKSP